MLSGDNRTVQIVADSSNLYQLQNNGAIWGYTGTPCPGSTYSGWQMPGNSPAAVGIAAGNGQLYQLHNGGAIWSYNRAPCNGTSCTGWREIDNNPKAVAIVAGNKLFKLHNEGVILFYPGTVCSGNTCPPRRISTIIRSPACCRRQQQSLPVICRMN